VYVSLGNSKFQIPAGEYAAQLSIHGSAIEPATSTDVTGVVQAAQSIWIIIKLEGHQAQNLPKASLLTVDLGGSDHLLSLSAAAMLRDLTIGAKYESDPLSSTR